MAGGRRGQGAALSVTGLGSRGGIASQAAAAAAAIRNNSGAKTQCPPHSGPDGPSTGMLGSTIKSAKFGRQASFRLRLVAIRVPIALKWSPVMGRTTKSSAQTPCGQRPPGPMCLLCQSKGQQNAEHTRWRPPPHSDPGCARFGAPRYAIYRLG